MKSVKRKEMSMERRRTICIANQKGGVGKTTTAFNFAVELTKRNYDVLLVDFDSQGNLTKSTGITEGKNSDNCFLIKETIAGPLEKIMNDEEIAAPDIPIYALKNQPNLKLIPCNVAMAKMKLKINLAMSRESLLDRVISTVRNMFDYIIIDTAPSLDVDMVNAFVAADELIVTMTPDTFSASGTYALIDTYAQVRKNLNHNLKIKGVLITKVDARTNFAQDMIDNIKSIWGKNVKIFGTVIPNSIKVQESQAAGVSIADYDKNNAAAKAYSLFTDEYLRNCNFINE